MPTLHVGTIRLSGSLHRSALHCMPTLHVGTTHLEHCTGQSSTVSPPCMSAPHIWSTAQVAAPLNAHSSCGHHTSVWILYGSLHTSVSNGRKRTTTKSADSSCGRRKFDPVHHQDFSKRAAKERCFKHCLARSAAKACRKLGTCAGDCIHARLCMHLTGHGACE